MNDSFDHRPLLIRLDQAAKILAVSRRTIVRLCEQGRLELVRVTPDTPRLRLEDVLKLASGRP